jgi:hypothetical protein
MSGHDGLREALNEAARDAHALTVRLLRNPVCSGPFETCPSPYCTRSRAALAEPVQPEDRACEAIAGSPRCYVHQSWWPHGDERCRSATPPASDPVGLDVERLAEVLNTGRYTGSMVAARAWAEDIGRRYAAYQERSRPENET